MKNLNHHIIQTHEVEIAFLQKQDSIGLQNRIADMVKEKLLPRLELLFDEQNGNKRHLKIDNLEIEFEINNPQNWEEEFVDLSVNKIKQKLNAINHFMADDETYEITYNAGEPVLQKKDTLYDEIEAVAFFLSYGILPWNFSGHTPVSLLQSITERIIKEPLQNSLQQKLSETVLTSAATFRRFVAQFPEVLCNSVLQSIQKNFSQTLSVPAVELLSHLQHWRLSDKRILKQLLLVTQPEIDINKEKIKIIFHESFSLLQIYELKALVDSIDSHSISQNELTSVRELIRSNISEPDTYNEPANIEPANTAKIDFAKSKVENFLPKQEYFIENAGLVILHPFLQRLFESLQYTEQNYFINEHLQQRAILLTQHLVSEENEIPEHQLLLNKILCGYPIFNAVEYELELTVQEQQEIDDLLLSVIEYWTALKNTSIEGLRNSFLKRPGKLVQSDECWILQVEQKSYDVLMNYLPWGIGIIKLPWMKDLLRVEWV